MSPTQQPEVNVPARMHAPLPSRERINVWDFVGPENQESLQDAAALVAIDSNQVFEMPGDVGTRSPRQSSQLRDGAPQTQSVRVDAAHLSSHDQAEEQATSLPLPAENSPSLSENGIPDDSNHPQHSAEGPRGIGLGQETGALQEFKNQIEASFEGNGSLTTIDQELDKQPKYDSDTSKEFAEDQSANQAVRTFEDKPRTEVDSIHNQGSQQSLDRGEIGSKSSEPPPTSPFDDGAFSNSGHGSVAANKSGSEVDSPSSPSTKRPSVDVQDVEHPETSNASAASTVNESLVGALEAHEEVGQSEETPVAEARSAVPVVGEVAANAGSDPVNDGDRVPAQNETGPLNPQIVMTPSQEATQATEVESASSMGEHQDHAAPSRPPPVPPMEFMSTPIVTSLSPLIPSDLIPVELEEEMHSPSSRRNSSAGDASSTISSSAIHTDGHARTLRKSTSGTTATSLATGGTDNIREEAQAELRRLHEDLNLAKARGDSRKAQASLQKSIDIIRKTYLSPSGTSDTQDGLSKSPKVKESSIFRGISSFTGNSNSQALCDAAASGNILTLKSLIDARANVDARGKAIMTPMMLAAVNGHIEILKILKGHGADEFAVDAKGRDALHLAVASNRPTVVSWLLEAYPPTQAPPIRHRSSILSKASETFITRAPKNLRETSDAEGSKPIHVAVEMATTQLTDILISAGVNLESKNNHGQTPLHRAVIRNARGSFDSLIRRGANVVAQDARAMTPLHWAAKTGHVDMIQTLLERNVPRRDFDSDGNQPIHNAALSGSMLGIEVLLGDRKDLNIHTKGGQSMLHIACLTKNHELAKYLLDNHVEVNLWASPPATFCNSLNKFKIPLTSLTPLNYACCQGDYEMALLLLEHGAWANACTPDGVTNLMMAVESEDTNTVNLLIQRGASVNASIPGSLMTALHIAARRGDLETVQQLCIAGANHRLQTSSKYSNYSGHTPLVEAQAKCTDEKKSAAVVTYLRRQAFISTQKQIQAHRQPSGPSLQLHSSMASPYAAPLGPPAGPMGAPMNAPMAAQPWAYNGVYTPEQQQMLMAQIYQQQQQISALEQQSQTSYYPQAGGPPMQTPMQMQGPAQGQVNNYQQWLNPPDPYSQPQGPSPPPYQAGGNAPAHLMNRQGVYRPGDSVPSVSMPMPMMQGALSAPAPAPTHARSPSQGQMQRPPQANPPGPARVRYA